MPGSREPPVALETPREEARRLARLRADWGRPVEHPRDYKLLREFTASTGLPSQEQVDEPTWNDLDMDEVFARVDRTSTASPTRSARRVSISSTGSAQGFRRHATR